MRTPMMIAAMTMGLMGCATDAEDPGTLETTSVPGHVAGTYALDGMSVSFDFSETAVIVKTPRGQTLLAITLDATGAPATRIVAEDLPEAALIEPLKEAVGEIVCPGPGAGPRWSWTVDRIDASF